METEGATENRGPSPGLIWCLGRRVYLLDRGELDADYTWRQNLRRARERTSGGRGLRQLSRL